MPRHSCSLCGQISFQYYHEYETHRQVVHGLKSQIKSEKVTGRSKAQIVNDAEETYLKPCLIAADTEIVLITGNDKVHLDACRCGVCFQKKLDNLVDNTQYNLDTMTDSFTEGGLI